MCIVYKRQYTMFNIQKQYIKGFKMIIYEEAHAKINLSLDITGRRPNGYHEVRMIMQTLKLCDDLSFEEGESGTGVTLVTDNEMLNLEQSQGSDNLIVKAVKKLTEKTGRSFDVKISLTKRIPIAAGLAGGSADAAATLRGLNRLFKLGLSVDELKEIAVKIGADVPFCVEGGLCLSEGIGEILTDLTPLPSYPTVLCKPNVNVSTKEVYEAFDGLQQVKHPNVDAMLEAISVYDGNTMCSLLGNVLEAVTKKMHPVIGDIEKSFLSAKAVNTVMSGSGPTVFGLFNSPLEAVKAAEILRKTYPEFTVCETSFYNNRKDKELFK